MNKNIIIALLAGLLIGGHLPKAQADTSGITRADLIQAAALLGVLANSNVNPYSNAPMFSTATDAARHHAKILLEGK